MITCDTVSARVIFRAPILFLLAILFISGAQALSAAIEIVEQPEELLECEGAKDLRLVAVGRLSDGREPSYSWYKDGAQIPGANSPIFPIKEISQDFNGVYKCRMSNPDDPAEYVDSRAAVVYRLGVTSIVRQDTLINPTCSNRLDLCVESHINGFTAPFFQQGYQWFRRRAGTDDEKITDDDKYTGSNTPHLIIKNIDLIETDQYDITYVLEIEGQCGKVYSKPVKINTRPRIRFIVKSNESVDTCDSMTDRETVNPELKIHFEYFGKFDSIIVETTAELDDTLGFNHINQRRVVYYNSSAVKEFKSWRKFWYINLNAVIKIRITIMPGGEVYEMPPTTWVFHSRPRIIKQTGDLEVVEGEPLELNVSATSTIPVYFQWYKNHVAIEGATESVYRVQSATEEDAGMYYVYVSNYCGLTAAKQINVAVKPKGIMSAGSQTLSAGILSLNPNPASEEIEIKFRTAGSGTAYFKILEASGREVVRFTAAAGEGRVRRDISSLASGAYWLVLETGGEKYIGKFAVVK